MLGRLACLLIALIAVYSCRPVVSAVDAPTTYEVQHSAVYDSAAISGPHPLATEVGQQVMHTGGNAIDAAVAVQLAMAVCYPRAGNLGGGGFMVYRTADGSVESLDYREVAPAAAYRDMYLDTAGLVVAGRSTAGHLAVGVPGTVAGLEAMHRRYGSMPWRALVKPAIRLAKEGYLLSAAEAQRLNYYHDDIQRYNDSSPMLEAPFEAGTRLVQHDLAATLERISDAGAADFYRGGTAAMIVNEMEQGGGIITMADLAAYTPVWRQAIRADYKEYAVYSMPPSSSGGVTLTQILEMIEPYDLAAMGHNTIPYIHLLAEAMRRAYADRAEYLGDTDLVDVPVVQLIDTAYLDARMADFDTGKAGSSNAVSAGTSAAMESYETTHISIVDRDGNAVSITTTLNGNYGSKVMVDGAGFFLNNEMDDFSAKPGVPNLYGLIGAEANAIAPGKRMLSSMTPTIVEKSGELYLVMGSPGGSTIITAVLQTLLNVTTHNMPIDSAIRAARIHHQWLPDEIVYERDRVAAGVVTGLQSLGHSTRAVGRIAVVKAIHRFPDGRLHAASDPRNPDDDVAGY